MLRWKLSEHRQVSSACSHGAVPALVLQHCTHQLSLQREAWADASRYWAERGFCRTQYLRV